MQEGRAAAVRELQPDPRRPAVQHQRRGGPRGARGPRRRAVGRRRPCRRAEHQTVFERRAPADAVVDAALRRRARRLLLDRGRRLAAAVPARSPGRLDARPRAWSAAATPGCGPRSAPSSATPAAAWCCWSRGGSAGRRPGATAASARPRSPTARRTAATRWPDEIRHARAARRTRTSTAIEKTVRDHAMDVDFERTGELSVAVEPHQVEWLRVGGRGRGRPVPRPLPRCGRRSTARRTSPGSPATDTALLHPAKMVARAGAGRRRPRGRDLRGQPRDWRSTRPAAGSGDAALATGTVRADAGGAGDQRVPRAAAAVPAASRCRSTTTR